MIKLLESQKMGLQFYAQQAQAAHNAYTGFLQQCAKDLGINPNAQFTFDPQQNGFVVESKEEEKNG